MADSGTGNELFLAVGEKIREQRIDCGFSQSGFARAAGLNPKFVWRIENGRQNLNLLTLARIAITLELPMSALLEGVDPRLIEGLD